MTLFGHKAPITAIIGMLIIVLNVAVALFGPWFAPYGETQVVGGGWDPASAGAWCGAEQIGRDMFTRLIYGARMTIGIAFVTTLLSFAVGITLGLTAAVAGKWVDMVISRLLARLTDGARMTIGIAFVPPILSFAVGITLGLTAAVAGRWVDMVISRLVD